MLGGYLPDFVLGANDGVITTLAVVSGVVGASLSSKIVVIMGFANLVADGISMAASNILGRRSETQKPLPTLRSAWPHGLATFIGFVAAGFVPLIAYLWPLFQDAKFTVAVILSLVTLFTVGAGRAIFTGRSGLTSGIEMLLIGATAAGAAYLIGALVAFMIAD
jgi:VIT1/CCC1 family predicted Fe2+/Mn2+ transporter